MGQHLLNDSVIILSELSAAFKALLKIPLPCGFEDLHVSLFPSLELLQWDAKLRCICLLRQAEFQAYGFDLRALTPQQKQVIVIQQILQRYLKQLRQLLHMLLRIKVPPCLFIMDAPLKTAYGHSVPDAAIPTTSGNKKCLLPMRQAICQQAPSSP